MVVTTSVGPGAMNVVTAAGTAMANPNLQVIFWIYSIKSIALVEQSLS